MKTFFSISKKLIISLFILASLWVTVSVNTKWQLPQLAPAKYPATPAGSFLARVNWRIVRGDWLIGHVGWIVGLRNYWRMFSPADRFNWHMKFYAIHADGSQELLPLANQQSRNFWQRNFTDFREAKFHLNIYNNKLGQRYYAEYLCHEYQSSTKPITSIRLDLESVNIYSPERAKTSGQYIDARPSSRNWGTFTCP